MQKNPVNKNGEENSMSSRTTPMHLNQKANEKMRKAHKTKEIMSLGQLVRGDSRIGIPLDRSTSNK